MAPTGRRGWSSPPSSWARPVDLRADLNLFKVTHDIDEAVEEICGFYSTFHSMRFVGRRLVLRLNRELTDAVLSGLDREFADIVVSGGFERTEAAPSEIEDADVPDLPRVAFRFDRMSYARLRRLINRINGRESTSPARYWRGSRR